MLLELITRDGRLFQITIVNGKKECRKTLEVKINFEFKKGVGITTKSKETNSLLASHLTNSYHSPVNVTYRYYMCLVKYNCSWVATFIYK